MDLKTLTDEELAQHLNDVMSEQERRQRLVNLPRQIEQMTNQYVDDGGDREDILNAVVGESA